MGRLGDCLDGIAMGKSKFSACLEEYACVIKALLTLFEAGLGTEHLAWAMEMTDKLKQQFKVENGAFYQNGRQRDSFAQKVRALRWGRTLR